MRNLRCLPPSQYLPARLFSLLLLGLLAFSVTSRADINTITKEIWKMKFGVTNAQAADTAPGGWMDQDTDGDGIKNADEVAAGTNPFSSGSVVRITGITDGGTTADLTFPTEDGKNYVVQGTPALTTAFTSTGVSWIGTGVPKTLTVTKGSNQFFRVLVQDIDSDSDGASNWAEKVAGYNPTNAADGGGTVLTNAIASSDLVTVSVTKPSATQPLSGFAPVETGSITISRGGPLKFHALTVPLQISGSATSGVDYDAVASSAVFPVGVGEVVLTINPKANSNRKTNVTAIVKALPGANYLIGGKDSGSVVINPAGIANGTGLTAVYHNAGSATYATQTGIFGGAGEMTRTDATVNFSSGANGWGAVGGPTGLSTASSDGSFSVLWTGQILPQYSETYNIDFRSDDGAKVWVNGVLLIDRWVTQSATDYVNSIALKGGTLYDIRIEYFNNATGSAEAKLSWWSASQTLQIIPQTRLFPAPTQANKNTTITSSLAAVGYENTPFTFNVTSPSIGGSGTTYALATNSGPLPPGLTLDANSGVVSGTPTTAGTYNVAIDALNVAASAVRGSSIVNFTIYPVGGVTRETLAGNVVTPDGGIASFDDETDYPNNTSRRLRGYLVPPKTGNYYFWLAANNTAELWVANDSEYVNRVRRATVTASTGKKVWSASTQSAWLTLVAGEKYYIEVLHNTGADADDYVSVGWCQDDIGTVPSVAGAPNATGAATSIPNGGGPLQGYPLSGTAPGYVFQPYDYPAVTPSTGTLYACNLGPQTSAITSASGSANIQVDAGETTAILHFQYQNLGTPKTSYHLHVDGFTGDDSVVHPQGEIIYDIDDADQNPSEQTGEGGYIWTFTPVGSFSTAAQLREALHKGKVYLNVHSVTYPAGEIRGTFGLIDGSQTPPDAALYTGANAPVATDVETNAAHAARFLNQATFGASPAEVAALQGSSFQAWITNQLAKPASHSSNEVVAGISSDINNLYPSSLFTNSWWKNAVGGEDQLRQRLAFALSEIMVISWANDTGPLARNARILADYYDQLVDYCLPTAGLTNSGNFRGILKSVTLTPAMGLYLDMRANQKGDDTLGRHPNENYGREIMQLFSVGIYRMWDDGRFVLGTDAGLVPTYSQPNIIGLASLFTGWNYAQANQSNGRAPSNFGPASDFLNPMVLVPTQHELGFKLLLNNAVSPAATGRTPRVSIASATQTNPCTITTSTVHGLTTGDTVRIAGSNALPGTINASFTVTVTSPTAFTIPVACTTAGTTAGTVTGATVTPAAISGTGGITAVTGSQADNSGTGANHPYDLYGLTELDRAIDNIVNNDNVPPYICRQLIQRLVTSDPSPGYIYRVVQKFKNNGSGVRGDLAAVVSQILLDGEARRSSVTQNSTNFGKQREPMLRLTGPARAFPSTDYTGTYTQLTGVNSNKLRIVTSALNDFSAGFTIRLKFTTPANPAVNPTNTNYSVGSTLGIAGIATGSPCVVTTADVHGLTTGDIVTITGVTGGSFSPTISNASFAVTVVDGTSFSIPVTCSTVPTANTGSIVGGKTLDVTATGMTNATYTQLAGSNLLTVNTGGPATNAVVPGTTVNISSIVPGAIPATDPCIVTTSAAHNLVSGGVVSIAGVTDGTFGSAITGTFVPTVTGANTFTVPVSCTAAAATGTTTKMTRSKVYLAFLTQTTAGGAVIPADSTANVGTEVQANPTTTSFTIATADIPGTARGGNVLLTKFTTSYTPSGTNINYNNNVNHNLSVGTKIWVDVPIVGSPVTDAEYAVSAVTDEDHFTTSRTPNPTNGGAYPNPSGSNNGITIYPLVPPPLGRSGTVVINQSTFNMGSTESTLTQSPLNAPTVFNYFFPDYKFPGTLANSGLDSPEFQLTTDTNVMNLTNSLTNMIIGTGGGNGNLNGLTSFNNGNGTVVLDIGSYLLPDSRTADASIGLLVDDLANLLVGAPLATSTRTEIVTFVANTTRFPYTSGTPTNLQKRDRVRAIIHLIITSAEYAVQK